tara:strand:- start:173 stop:424 length:252 start_codon:yes stop_codon:yes gene_type:complete
VLSERRRRALLFVFFFVFVFLTQKEMLMTEMGKKRFLPRTTTLGKFFCVACLSKMERKSDDFDFFSRFFGQTTPQKVAAAAAF